MHIHMVFVVLDLCMCLYIYAYNKIRTHMYRGVCRDIRVTHIGEEHVHIHFILQMKRERERDGRRLAYSNKLLL